MKLRTRAHSLPGPSGFSLVELMIVVALIVIMAAVALPNIAGYLRQARVRGAMQQVAGEMQTARNKAIVKNTNRGVAFAVIDADTYRFFISDPPTILGPLQSLPSGVRFVPSTEAGFAFNRLGGACKYGAGGCPVLAAPTLATLCSPAEMTRCTDNAQGPYVGIDAAGSFVVDLIETTTQLRRRVEVASGGRVVTQR